MGKPGCDNCPHAEHRGWCPTRIPASTGDTDPCSCYAGTEYAEAEALAAKPGDTVEALAAALEATTDGLAEHPFRDARKWAADIIEAEPRLTLTPGVAGTPSLDATVLAQAWNNVMVPVFPRVGVNIGWWRKVAAEYTRLSESSPKAG